MASLQLERFTDILFVAFLPRLGLKICCLGCSESQQIGLLRTICRRPACVRLYEQQQNKRCSLEINIKIYIIHYTSIQLLIIKPAHADNNMPLYFLICPLPVSTPFFPLPFPLSVRLQESTAAGHILSLCFRAAGVSIS